MKKQFFLSLSGLILLSLLAGPGLADEGPGHGGPGMDHSSMNMKSMQMKMKKTMHGMQCSSCRHQPGSLAARLDMMTCMLTGRMPMQPEKMRAMMRRVFYLDRIEELGLQPDQVARLKQIQADCRRDNLRTAAEVKIARFDLSDLLEGDWSLDAAEQLVRKIAKLEGDLKVRHLRAVKEASAVLSPEQVKKLATADSPESLFDN